jgi:3-hydroxyacyl-[acyl-carrier-protein] dehydratase
MTNFEIAEPPESSKAAGQADGPGTEIDIHEIMRRIPHRPPFLMIDRAERYAAGKSLVGVKCVTINEPFFVGHFPGAPVMPGVLIVEAMAQTGGLLMSKSWNADPTGKIILFMSVDNCRFRLPVRPGDVLRLDVQVLRTRANVVKFSGRALVGEKLAAEADFAAMLVDAPH